MTQSSDLVQQVTEAFATGKPLNIKAGGSKAFLSRANLRVATPESQQLQTNADVLDVSQYNGVISYEPTELVITAKCGTPIKEIAELLDTEGQELSFDPPVYSGSDTIGGVVAAAVSGPSRIYRGGVRDYILGTSLINGRGELLRFGGTVMKNVAGYDVSRLQVGARGALGVLLDLSIKVLPKTESGATTRFSHTQTTVREALRSLERQPLPLDAAAIVPDGSDNVALVVRFSGSDAAVQRALKDVGGDVMPPSDAENFWTALRDLDHPIFNDVKTMDPGSSWATLWRFVLSAETPVDEFLNELPGNTHDDWLLDWGGRLRWVRTDAEHSTMQAIARRFNARALALGSQAQTSGGTNGSDDNNLQALNLLNGRIKKSFDPAGILNPGQWPFEADPDDKTTVQALSDSVEQNAPANT